jgi:hypothetical protein
MHELEKGCSSRRLEAFRHIFSRILVRPRSNHPQHGNSRGRNRNAVAENLLPPESRRIPYARNQDEDDFLNSS